MLGFLITTSLLSGLACAITDAQHGDNSTFDYVIVGGGTAGLVLANRLSADASNKVAVIEAGSRYEVTYPLAAVPVNDVTGVGADPTDIIPAIDWGFITTPQAGANGRSIAYTRGKTLGGSSARNFMIYQRGTRGSYDSWAAEVGDDSYTFDNWLPYFKKSVNFTSPKSPPRAQNATALYVETAFESTGGPLQVSYPNYAQPFSSYLQSSLIELGLPNARDFNSGELLGTQYCASTIDPDHATRESSETSFLHAAFSRPNLVVFQNTTALKILFKHKKAIAVKTNNAAISTVRAKNEIILSAGAFQSPQLLLLSGVGPADTLKKFNISVIADRPGVGKNLTDHVFMGPSHRVNVQTNTRLAVDQAYAAAEFVGEYSQKQEGPLTNPSSDLLGWEKTPRRLLSSSAASKLDAFPRDWPEIEYLTAPGYVGNFSSLTAGQPKDGYQYGSILGALVAPLSRGEVTLKSANPLELPSINPNWLTHPVDVEVAVATYKRLREAFATSAMAPVLVAGPEYFPGPDVQSDEQILEIIRETVMTVWHAAGTCRMGKHDDHTAVVDSKARVIGVSNLRVVDASAFALLPPGHPQSTVYALAEKIADEMLSGGCEKGAWESG